MTFEQLKELICENFGVSEDKVTETADLQEELKLDSLDDDGRSSWSFNS